jgi:hypothetical protein
VLLIFLSPIQASHARHSPRTMLVSDFCPPRSSKSVRLNPSEARLPQEKREDTEARQFRFLYIRLEPWGIQLHVIEAACNELVLSQGFPHASRRQGQKSALRRYKDIRTHEGLKKFLVDYYLAFTYLEGRFNRSATYRHLLRNCGPCICTRCALLSPASASRRSPSAADQLSRDSRKGVYS